MGTVSDSVLSRRRGTEETDEVEEEVEVTEEDEEEEATF